MLAEIVFFTTYDCPRCHVALEAAVGKVPAWLRCPNCGKAGLPPEKVPVQRVTVAPGGTLFDPMSDDPEIVMGVPHVPGQTLPVRPRAMAPLPAISDPRRTHVRLLLGIGFFVTTCIFLFSMLERSGLRSTSSGVAALVFLFFLCRPVGRPPGHSSIQFEPGGLDREQ